MAAGDAAAPYVQRWIASLTVRPAAEASREK